MKIKSYLIAFTLTLFSCEKADPVTENEPKIVTTLIYNFRAEDGSTVQMNYQDRDGSGGNPPEISVGDLKANTTYKGILFLLD
ncbi:MAG: hypothetical protein ACI9V1_001234 [Spirosomataceae bacterium]